MGIDRKMSKASFQQQEALADFLEQNPVIAKGLLRTAFAKLDTKKKWNDISLKLNALGGVQKNGRSWAKFWADKKWALKKKCAQHTKSRMRKGGGSEGDLPLLTPLEQCLAVLIGALQTPISSHVSLNLLPATSTTSPSVPTARNVKTLRLIPIEKISVQHGKILVPHSEVQKTDSLIGHNEPNVSKQVRRPIRVSQTSTKKCSWARKGALTPNKVTIRRQQVEAKTILAKGLKEAAGNLSLVASAINNVAAAVTEAAQVIAQALSISSYKPQ